VLVWLAVAIIGGIRGRYFLQGNVSLPETLEFAAGLVALLLIGEITVRILDWAERHLLQTDPGAAMRGPLGRALERLTVGDVVLHRLHLPPGRIEYVLFRSDGVVFVIETHPGTGTVDARSDSPKLNDRALPGQLFKDARRKLDWLKHFLAEELGCNPSLQAGIVFPNADVFPGYDSDDVALLGLDHLQPWLDSAESNDQFSKRLWPHMTQVKRELLACSTPLPPPAQGLPVGVVLALGIVWLTFSAAPVVRARTAPVAPPTGGRTFNTIVLEGVGGAPPRRVAMINGETVREGEWIVIKVAGKDIGIRCESILGESATIAIDNTPGTKTIHLRQGAGETRASAAPAEPPAQPLRK
jgi:hypothetical protein